MNFLEYGNYTIKTMKDLGSQVLNSVHMTMGIATEVFELREAIRLKDEVNIKEEIGDMLWYLRNYFTIWDISTEHIAVSDHISGTIENKILFIEALTSSLLDMDKKTFAYGKEYPMQERVLLASSLLEFIYDLCILKGYDMNAIMQTNVDKLVARYGEKFSEEKAINRNLDSERKILES